MAAEQRLAKLQLGALAKSGSILDLQAFLSRFSNQSMAASSIAPSLAISAGNHVEDASRLLHRRIQECSESEPLEQFIRQHPESEHRSEVEQRLTKVLWGPLKRQGKSANLSDLRAFIERFPTSPQACEAQALVATLSKTRWRQLKRTRDRMLLEQFLAEFPDVAEAPLAKARISELEGKRGTQSRLEIGPADQSFFSRWPVLFATAVAIILAINVAGREFFSNKNVAGRVSATDPNINGYEIHGVNREITSTATTHAACTSGDCSGSGDPDIAHARKMGFSVTMGKSLAGQAGETYDNITLSACLAHCSYCGQFDYDFQTKRCRTDSYPWGRTVGNPNGVAGVKATQ